VTNPPTSRQSKPPADPTAEPLEPPPCPPALVEEMLKVFDKTIKAHQLYLPNNPTYLKAIANAKAAIAPVWEHTGSLVFTVTDTQFKWYGVVVNDHPDKGGDSLPWLLFKDGLRELTLFPGFEDEEMERFLAIIPRVRHAQPHEDDLLTILWEQDFQTVRYRYVEINDPAAPLDPDGEPGRWPVAPGQTVEPPAQAIQEAQEEQQEGEGSADAPPRPGVVKMEDFDASLYFLDPNEIDYLQKETAREYTLDLRRLVLNALLDIYELQADPLVREEIAGDLEALVLHLLTAGQFATVAYMLQELQGTMQRARELRPIDRERLGKLPDRLSNPDALGQMLQALEETSDLPSKDDLTQLFAQLKPTALAGLLDHIDRTQSTDLRPLLEASAERLASSNTGELVKLITNPKPAVAREAIRRAGAMKTQSAVPALGQVLASDAERPMRAAATAALTEIGSAGALSELVHALNDPDRDIRLTAMRALTLKSHRPALDTVKALVTGKESRAADRTERIAIFELYGALCGDAGVGVLDAILNAKGGLFGKREDPEFRACAAVGLGRINTDASRASLQKASSEKDVIVRTAVSRALKGPTPGATQ
jgi:HEAT repeat protein